MSPSRIAAKTLPSLPSSETISRGGVTGVKGGSRRSSWPGHADDVPEVGEVEHARRLVDLLVLDLERRDQLLAQLRAHPLLDLEPDDLAEAAATELLLDRPHHVAGLVGNVVVGVARDSEERLVDHLHPGEQRADVGGDQRVERDQRPTVLADPQEAAEELLRHLDPGEDLVVLVGVVEDDRDRE